VESYALRIKTSRCSVGLHSAYRTFVFVNLKNINTKLDQMDKVMIFEIL